MSKYKIFKYDFQFINMKLGYLFVQFTRKQNTFYQPKHEMGTDGNDIDYEWIPRANLIGLNFFLLKTRALIQFESPKLLMFFTLIDFL